MILFLLSSLPGSIRYLCVFLEEMPFNGSATFDDINWSYKGTFGIIPSFSRTFCGTCNRIRLSATGELRTCLYGAPAANLRDVLRNGADEAAIKEVILLAVSNRLKDGFAAERVNTKTVH